MIRERVSVLGIAAALLALVVSLAQFTILPATLAASRPPARGKHGMVASVSEIASQVGVDVL